MLDIPTAEALAALKAQKAAMTRGDAVAVVAEPRLDRSGLSARALEP